MTRRDDTHAFIIAARRAAKAYGRVWPFLTEEYREAVIKSFIRQYLAKLRHTTIREKGETP